MIKTEILEELQRLFECQPQLRFGQLFSNVTGGSDPFYLPDDYLLNLMLEYRLRIEKARQEMAPEADL